MLTQSEPLRPELQRMVDAGISGLDIMHGHLKVLMVHADKELADAIEIEENNGYSDAMDSMERKYWEGVSETLSDLYSLTYDLSFAIADRDKND